MTAPKAKTLQQRFGFRDNDLKTPKHDEMMLWLHENMVEFLTNNQLWSPAEYTLVDMDRQKESWASKRFVGLEDGDEKKAFSGLEYSDLPPLPQDKDKISILWEVPITSGQNKFMIGFIDMVVKVECDWRYAFDTDRKWYSYAAGNRVYYIELKTKIPSLGELIRQIRMYQVHAARGKWIVVCPDDRFKEPLASQGITLIKYVGGGVEQKRLI